MNSISTKELAEAWNISISRVVRLAKAGRIPGARLVGKSWMFPADAKKPEDKRRKKTTEAGRKPDFRFPLYPCTFYPEEVIQKEFSDDERTLYEAEILFTKYEISESVEILEKLLASTHDRYVRFGALYILSSGMIFLRNYAKACSYYHEFHELLSGEKEHKQELEFLAHDLEAYFSGNAYYLEEFHLDPQKAYDPSTYGYLLLQSAYADLFRSMLFNTRINTSAYQIFCENDSIQTGILVRILLPLYLAIILKNQQQPEESKYYLLQSCLLAEKYHMAQSTAAVFPYFAELFSEVLEKDYPVLYDRLHTVAMDHNAAVLGLLEYLKKKDPLQLLAPGEYQFVQYAINGMSHKEISSVLQLSIVSISKKYAAIYEKTGTHNKTELAKMYRDAFTYY